MSNGIYAKAFQQFLSAGINLVSGDIRVIAVDSQEYTPNLASHEFLSSVPSGGRVAVSGALTGKSVTDGVFDADDVTLTSVTGDQFEYLLFYLHTGSDATARLIYLMDTATGLPATPGGGNITLTWSNGADKIFSLKNPA
jgi:hypothetical protein